MPRTKRRGNYKKGWKVQVYIAGCLETDWCGYCGVEKATTIDHVMPVSYRQNHNMENLVPCCVWCNTHLSDFIFADESAKRDYVYETRRRQELPVEKPGNVRVCRPLG